MKQIIKLLVLICLSLPLTTQAQPLYRYSQFDLSTIFGQYRSEIEAMYQLRLYKDKTPEFTSYSPFNICQSQRYKEEADIPLRHLLDSLVPPSQHYVFVCPVYRVCNKVLIGIFPGGIESIWQQPRGNLFYMITQDSSMVALMYDKVNNVVRRATHEEIVDFARESTPNLYGYAGLYSYQGR